MNKVDLAFTPALEQAKFIRQKEISPLELVEIYLERIEQFDSRLGSFHALAAEMAIADAREKTEQLAQIKDSSQLPPFFGIPIAIKDLNSVAGMPCSYGVAALRERIASYDDGVVTRMKMAGFTILGKSATSQMGSFPYTEPPGFAPTRNPWNLDYTAGGSSGGSAAAVAAGFCSVAQGSDGGGSIRIPSACCGLVGIKPSRGRVSNAPVGDFLSGISANGPLARTVKDAAALLDVMSGYITGDPYWLPEPEISFLEATDRDLPQLRVAFASVIPPLGETVEIYREAINQTVANLEEMGHIIEPGCPDFSELIEPFTRVWRTGVTASSIPLELFSPMNRWLGEGSGSAGEYLQAVSKMQVIARKIVSFFDNFDILVLPVYMHPPIRIGEWENLSFPETLDKIIRWVGPCPCANASGLPAIAIPVGFDPNGLPIAIQLIGRPADEATIIALAARLEAVNPSNVDRPALFSANQ